MIIYNNSKHSAAIEGLDHDIWKWPKYLTLGAMGVFCKYFRQNWTWYHGTETHWLTDAIMMAAYMSWCQSDTGPSTTTMLTLQWLKYHSGTCMILRNIYIYIYMYVCIYCITAIKQKIIARCLEVGKPSGSCNCRVRDNAVCPLQDCVGFRYNPPHYVAEALREIYQQETSIRILDCASGTGLVAEKVGVLAVSPA